jgi:predicted Zn-ribbon and HTH transcriptional regulator
MPREPLTECFIRKVSRQFSIMEDVDQSKVFFICKRCGYVFEENPELSPVRCPQCGSEDTDRT